MQGAIIATEVSVFGSPARSFVSRGSAWGRGCLATVSRLRSGYRSSQYTTSSKITF
jgi:hypothetical protein